MFVSALIDRLFGCISRHQTELGDLDRAIGDGDHGLNMMRGMNALIAARDHLEPMPADEALREAGHTIVMSVGGAAGPLYGSLLIGMGRAPNPRLDTLLSHGVRAVMHRGRSVAGEKTMLDVLIPVADAVRMCPDRPFDAARAAADRGLASTRDMKATKGRAAWLGERSIGHLDPGARSSALLVHAVCDVLQARP